MRVPLDTASSRSSASRLAPLSELSKTSRRYALALFDALRLFIDGVATLISGWLAYILYVDGTEVDGLAYVLHFFQALDNRYASYSLLAGIVFALLTFFKYGRGNPHGLDQILQRLVPVWCLTLLFVVGLLFFMKTGGDFSRGWIILWALIAPLLLILARYVERAIVSGIRRAGFTRQRIALVGRTPQAQRLLRRLRQEEFKAAYDIVGVFDDEAGGHGATFGDTVPLGSIDDLRRLCDHEHLDAIVLALPGSDAPRIQRMVERLMDLPSNILLGPDLAHFDLTSRPSAQLGTLPASTLTRLPMRDWAGLGKWIEDKVIVLIAGLFLAPLLLLVALLIKLDSRGPVLFRQKRFGFNNKTFDVFKFRTMHVSASDALGSRQTERHDPRVTRVGCFLRRASIDELPQLLNVWLGQMSIVGPRAHPIGMLVADQPYQEIVRHYAARHRVKPGITGLAQVNGNRGMVDTPEKAKSRVHFDLFYIEHWSVWLDLSILLRTVIKLPFDDTAF